MGTKIYKFLAVIVIAFIIGEPGVESASDGACPSVCPSACPRVVPPGYRNMSGLGLYKAHWEWLSWFGAKAACEREGGDLVVINSQAEAEMVQSVMNTYNGINYFHVGFIDVSADGTYVTVFGDRLSASGYNVWGPGQPSQVGRKNCGAIHNVNGLSDVLCKRELPFLCELSQ